MRWQLRFTLNDLSSHKLWLEENSLSRIAEKRKRQRRQKPFSLLHLTRAQSHLPESDNANVCYVVSHNSFLNLFVELGPSRNSPSYNWREEWKKDFVIRLPSCCHVVNAGFLFGHKCLFLCGSQWIADNKELHNKLSMSLPSN